MAGQIEVKEYNREEVGREVKEILKDFGDYMDGNVAYYAEKQADVIDIDAAERKLLDLMEQYIPFP